jgi:arylsulfatase A-like enzyme
VTMSRRTLLCALAAAAAIVAAEPTRTSAKPNFVFLFTDDQRFDTIAALGHPVVQTPNLDRLARRGVSFTHAYTQSGMVGGICAPSRAQLMTGRSVFLAHRHVVAPQTPDPAYITFPERLRQHGYETFAIGKWHNSVGLLQKSFSGGASIFFGGMSNHVSVPVFDYDTAGEYPKSKARSAGAFSSEAFTNEAIRFLKTRNGSNPFLLYVAYMSPHDPRVPPKRYADLYDPATIALPANYLPEHPFDNGNLRGRDEQLAGFPRTPEEVRGHIAAYYGMISEVDAQIGRVLDAVEHSGQAANTYVIFASDNGLAVGQHGLMGKQSLYDHSLRVPMIISGPGIKGGARAHGLVHVMDLHPTILELAGVPAPSPLDGRSLTKALRQPNTPLRTDVMAAYQNVQRSIRIGRWKLILYNVGGEKHTQLFDLTTDPLETRNLADDTRHAGRLRELKALLLKRLKEAEDADLEKWSTM